MRVLLRNANGPVEGWTRASFRVALSDEGIGELEGVPEAIDPLTGTNVIVQVDGVDVFQFAVEERLSVAEDVDEIVASGRGAAAALERAIVLPPGYPTFTQRFQTLTGAPFAIWADVLAQAQGRGRLPGYTPTWTATEDSNGDPWQANITVQLDPGTNLKELLREVGEVEGAEWIVRPDLSIDAAPVLGVDRSTEVVLFVGRNQVSRGRKESTRRQRQTIFLEASTGVSESTNTGLDVLAGEIWLEGQDFADPTTRPFVAAQIAAQLGQPEVEVDVRVAPDCGIFTRFDVGDIIGLDTGSGPVEFVRVVGASVEIEEDNVEVELTLVSEIALRSQQLDRAIQAKADVQLAASTSFQRRHGLVTADRFLTGAVGSDVAIASANYVPDVAGWAILGDGTGEFNDVTIRGDLRSVNYVSGSTGWALDRDGNLELNQGTVRGELVAAGINAANLTVGTLNVDRIAGGSITGAKIAGGTITGANISGGTITGANIASGTIGGVNIADLAIIASKIADGAAIRRTIALGSVNNVRVANDINGDRITAGTISGITGNFVGLTSVGLTVNVSAIAANAGINSTSGSFSSAVSNSGMPTSTDTTLPTVRRRGDNVLVSVASSAALKADLEEAPGDARILDLKLRTWRSLADGDDPDRRFYGLVAEEVREAGLEALVYDDVDGRPSGVAYDMVGVHLLPIVRQLTDRITELEERLR